VTLLAFAAERRCCWSPGSAAVDRYLLPALRLAVSGSKPAAAAVEWWDRQTGGSSTVSQSPLPHIITRAMSTTSKAVDKAG